MGDRLPRKLAAILYADVAGYSRLTGEDEDATHRLLTEHLDLISATVEGHRGRVMHYAGDAVLAMFEAVVDSVSCATEIQGKLDTADSFLYKNVFLGHAHLLRGEHDRAVELAEKHERIAGNEAASMAWAAWIHCAAGDPQRGVTILEKGVRQMRQPIWHMFEQLGVCQLLLDDYQAALQALEGARATAADPAFPHALKAAVYVESGEPVRARAEMRSAFAHRPELTAEHFRYYLNFRDPAQRRRMYCALAEAGLPGR